MQTNDTRPSPMFQAVLIWGALLVSQGMVVMVSQTAVVHPLSAPDQMPASAAGHIDPVIFYGVAAVIAVAAFFLPKLLMVSARKTLTPDSSLADVVKRTFPIWLVRWALLEAITMIGFVDSMLSTNPSAIYPYAFVSLVGFVITFPTEAKLRAA